MTILARQMTLATTLERNSRLWANRVALVCGATAISYSRLSSEVDGLVDALRSRGVARGTRVGVLMRNCHLVMEILFALSKLGAVMVPLNWRLTPSEMQNVVRDSDSMVLVCGSDFEESVRGVVTDLGTGVTAVHARDLTREACDGFTGSGAALSEVHDHDVAVQMYTAAFAGRPRGAQITHGGYLASAVSLSIALSLTETDSSLVALPLFHTLGLEMTLVTLLVGGKSVLVDAFEAASIAEMMERERVSVFPCAGQQLEKLAEELERRPRDISSLRIVMGSGASREMRERIRALSPRARFVDAVYGQTECGAMVTGCDTEEAEAIGDGCAGRATVYSDVRVFGQNDIELAPGQVGEIVVRGPRVMAGYYKLQRLNEEALQGGWLHTGDLGTLDERGYLHYVGRKRELIKSGMENVYPAEVETVLYAHPAVREAVVIGVPDAQWGEAVTAIVALNNDCKATAEDLIQFCKERIAGYKKPKFVHLVDQLPRDSSGQIARQEVRVRYGAMFSQEPTGPQISIGGPK